MTATITARVRPPRRCTGSSLVEGLVALVVMSFGMIGLVGLQSTLRENSDIAKQRSEALRLGGEEMEKLQAFAQLGPDDATAGLRGFDDLDRLPPQATFNTADSNTTFAIQRTLSDLHAEGYKTARVVVGWQDRAGNTQTVTLQSLVTQIDPALSGRLSMTAAGTASINPDARPVGLPVGAYDLRDGRSAFMPSPRSNEVWVFNNVTGVLTTVCESRGIGSDPRPLPNQLANCQDLQARMVSGFVRFGHLSAPATAEAASAAGDLPGTALSNLAMRVASTDAPTLPLLGSRCFTHIVTTADVPATSTSPEVPAKAIADYACLVPLGSTGSWTGKPTWDPTTVTPVASYTLCRFASAAGPAEPFTNVKVNLAHQNFLVVAAATSCPPGTVVHDPLTR